MCWSPLYRHNGAMLMILPQSHVHNKEDPVPLLPPTILGYRHPAQEVHITQTKVVECPGAENQVHYCYQIQLYS